MFGCKSQPTLSRNTSPVSEVWDHIKAYLVKKSGEAEDKKLREELAAA